jgi:CheY-like chemotaxis protein
MDEKVRNLSGMKVLVADDDPDDRELLRECLMSLEPTMTFFTAENGAQLLEFITGQGKYLTSGYCLPDMIIADINMPVMDGLTAIKRLQELRYFNHIPIFILTTSADELLRRRCLDAGARKVFVKPAHLARLKEIVMEIYSVCRLQVSGETHQDAS